MNGLLVKHKYRWVLCWPSLGFEMKAAVVLVFFAAVGQISALPWMSAIKDGISKGKENLNLDKIKETIDDKKTDMTNRLEENLNLDKIKDTIDEKKADLADRLDSIKELPSEVSEAIKNKAEEAQEKAEKILEEMKDIQENGETMQKDVADILDELVEQGSDAFQKGKEIAEDAAGKGKEVVDKISETVPSNGIWSFWARLVNWFSPKPTVRSAEETSEKWSEAIEKNNATPGGFLTSFWRGSKKE